MDKQDSLIYIEEKSIEGNEDNENTSRIIEPAAFYQELETLRA